MSAVLFPTDSNGSTCDMSQFGRGRVKTPRYFVFRGLLTPPKVAIVEYSAI